MIKFEHNTTSIHIPILIVGGGITGLAAALFLEQQGVRYLLIERHQGTTIQPKSRTIDIRTMELFRELGLSHTLREAGKAMAPAWGILHGQNLVETLQNRVAAAKTRSGDSNGLAQLQQLAAGSPESVCRCTQDISEAVLLKTALERGGDVRFHHEMTHFQQIDQYIQATILNRETGQPLTVTADYMIAADGANSPVRNQLKAAVTGVGTIANFLNIYFEADLAELVRGNEFSQFLVRTPELTGFLLSINNSNRWAFHLKYYPEQGGTPTDYEESDLITLLRRLIGMPALAIRILRVLPWPLAVRVANEMQFGRVFLAGDAAHTMTPYAGKGANSGVQDVHNLAWKVGAVLRGEADEKLLATYQAERQPVGAFYAHLSGQLAAPDGLIDDQKMAGQVADLLGLPNYSYTSQAIAGGSHTDQSVNHLMGRPGTRLPHVWLDEPHQQSSLDWIKRQFCLIVSGPVEDWQSIIPPVTHATGLGLPVYGFAREADEYVWQQLTATQTSDALLVRPDGFVAARLPSATKGDELVEILQKILAKSA